MNIWDPEYRSCDKEEHIYKDNEPYVDISVCPLSFCSWS